MLTLLIPFIALLAGVQAQQDLEKPCIVDFIGKDSNKDYNWNKVASVTAEEKLSDAEKESGIVGRISLPRSDILAGFSWQNGSQCSVSLDAPIDGGSFTYELDTGIRHSNSGNTQEGQGDINSLHVKCDGQDSPGPTSSPDPHSNLPPSFPDLTVKFFASPENVTKPVWFLDITTREVYVGNKDQPVNDVKPADLEDGSVGIGQMMLTHPSVRHFGYQRKLKGSNDVNIDDCEFDVREDLSISVLYYWPDSKRWEVPAKEGQEVAETPEKKVKDMVSLVCRDKDGNEV